MVNKCILIVFMPFLLYLPAFAILFKLWIIEKMGTLKMRLSTELLLRRRINSELYTKIEKIRSLDADISTGRLWEGLTSDVNGLQGKGFLLIVNQSGLLCLVSHGWQGLCWAGVWALWTRCTHTQTKLKFSINMQVMPQCAYNL